MNEQRRQLLAGGAIGAAALIAGACAQIATAPAAAAQPTLKPPPGKPGDFHFLTGEWTIANRRLTAPGQWDEFPGEATVHEILAGVGSIEELRIPARKFSGMGLRLLDVEAQVWSDFWVNSRSGVLTTPGQQGGFIDGAGIFESDDMDGDQPIKARGTWDEITPTSCRWRQSVSRDGGKTWEDNWIMHWTRAV